MSLQLFSSEPLLPFEAQDSSSFHSHGLLDLASRDLFGTKPGKFMGASHDSIAFIDPTVTNYQSLIQGIEPDIQVVVLDPNKDGVKQITDALTGDRFEAVHIISHGSPGSIQLGSSDLGYDNLTQNAGVLQQWKDSLTADADILLYGCDVAAGEQGEAFVKQLGQLTEADVAASDDLIGSAAKGGDWELEVTTGSIEAPLPFQASVLKSYNDVLLNNNPSNGIVISQVYGGGGSSNNEATYKNDFIELYNRGTTAVDVTGWSVQYASATGASWQLTSLSGSIAPGSYYLVQQGSNTSNSTAANLPTPDRIGATNMSATSGKVALVNNTTALTGATPTGSNIIDFVGYGTANHSEIAPTTALSITNAAIREAGNPDTDNNLEDFEVKTPQPRNRSSVPVAPTVTLVADTTPVENTSTNGSFTINLSAAAPAGGLTVNFNTIDSTATSDSDYTLVGTNNATVGANTLTIAAGATTATLSMEVVNDLAAEADETVKLNLTSGTGYSLGVTGSETASLTIAANDTGVVNTNDSDEGSLRQAILNANAFNGTDTISFNIPGSEAHTITLLSALPSITDSVIIDGTTQPGFSTTPIIELNGSNIGTDSNGLVLATGSGGSTIQGLVINNFWGNGIEVQSSNNTLKGNYIGTDVTGTASLGNRGGGVLINDAANNIVGGSTTAERNLISGNRIGVSISGSNATDNTLKGNYIGTDVTGTASLGNRGGGVLINDAANNIVGGSTTAERNLISGNRIGVSISGSNATDNTLKGNYIGTDVTGTASLGNGGGVVIDGAANNIVGGSTTAERNLISGNFNGVSISGSNATDNTLKGNYIGTDVTGTVSLGNGGGVVIDGAANNIVGGSTTAERNLISGNYDRGVVISGSSATDNTLKGNYIGTDVTGTASLGNRGGGVLINDAANNIVGGSTTAERNLISGNYDRGVSISGSNATDNTLKGNYIGTDVTGTASLGNRGGVVIDGAANNIVGGSTTAERNLISGNDFSGVSIYGSNAKDNTLKGNYIGTDVTGTASLGNGGGVVIDGAANNIVGGSTTAERNLISGNYDRGVSISGSNATDNTLKGNYIGTDVTGTASLGNGDGVVIDGAANNIVGGSTPAERNLISGNFNGVVISGSSATSNTLKGNYIGTDVTGTASLGNSGGGVIINDAAKNIVGGSTTAERNLISGNYNRGVSISGSSATDNTLKGNYIGTDVTGTASLGNDGGVVIDGAANNVVGGSTTAERNLISGNDFSGVSIGGSSATGNRILANSIFGNEGLGINLDYDDITANDAGDSDTGPNNLQNFPTFTSATVSGSTLNLTYTVDSSTANSSYPLQVEFFLSDGTGEGKTFLGADTYNTANTDQTTSLTLATTVNVGDKIVATVTDNNGNTSEFSTEQVVASPNTPPVLDLNGSGAGNNYNTTFTRGGSAVSIVDNSNLNLSDDGTTISSATVSIENLLNDGNEELSAITKDTKITYEYKKGVLRLTGEDTVANYQNILRSLTYKNTATIPNITPRSIQFVINDGSAKSNVATTTLAINAPTTNLGSGSNNITPGNKLIPPIGSINNTTPDVLYPFTLSNATQVAANLIMNSGSADMALLDSNGAVLQSSTRSGTLSENISRSGLSAGNYFIRVYQASPGETPNYKLTLKFA